jgi:hypothetical protein
MCPAWGGVAMDPQVEGTDTEPCGTKSERAPGHVRLGAPSNLPAELSTFVGRADDLESRRSGNDHAA